MPPPLTPIPWSRAGWGEHDFPAPGPGQQGTGFVELPHSLVQDFTLFVILRERNIAIWRRKLDWIAERGGMALLKTHPDYMCFALADALLEVLQDRTVRDALVAEGYDYVHRHNWDARKFGYLELVDSLTTETFGTVERGDRAQIARGAASDLLAAGWSGASRSAAPTVGEELDCRCDR